MLAHQRFSSNRGGIQCTGTGNAFSAVDVAVFVDGSITNAQRRVVAANAAGIAQVVENYSCKAC